jgi:RNA polymerase sigma factor (sigma-70 family)
MKLSLEEDKQLLSRIFSGDRKASEMFVRQFSDLVYKSIQATLLVTQVRFNKQDLEDMHNTVFLQLFEDKCKKLRQFEGRNGCSLASWIKLVAGRIVLNYIRKKDVYSPGQRKRLQTPDDLPELAEENQKSPLAFMEEEERNRRLHDGINSLQPRDALFIKLHIEKGLPIEEVGEVLHLTMQNAYTMKHRIIKKLKAFLDTGYSEK